MIDLFSGTLESVTDIALLGGANVLAVESGAGQWEIVQAGSAELIAPGRYRLTHLLRGQRGTAGAMGHPTPAGARVVVPDATLASLPIAKAELGLPWNWRIGPAAGPISDENFVATSFTPSGRGLRSVVRRLPAFGLQLSFAIGVGRSRAMRSSPFSSRRSPPRLRKLSVCGVGQRAAVVARFMTC